MNLFISPALRLNPYIKKGLSRVSVDFFPALATGICQSNETTKGTTKLITGFVLLSLSKKEVHAIEKKLGKVNRYKHVKAKIGATGIVVNVDTALVE